MKSGEGIVKGSMYMALGGALATGLRYAFQILAARWLGAAGFGVVSNLFSWVLTISGVLSLGIATTLVRYISHHEAQGQSMKPVIRNGVMAESISVLGFLFLCGLFRKPFTRSLFDGNTFLFLIMIGGVLGYGALTFLQGILRGLRQFLYSATSITTLAVARLSLSAVLIVGLGYGATGAAWAILLSPLPVLALALYWCHQGTQYDKASGSDPMPLHSFLAFALPATIISGIDAFLPRSGTILINLLAVEKADELVGLFTAAALLARLPELFVESISAPLLSNVSRADAMNNRPLVRQYTTRMTQAMVALALAYMLGISILGPRLVPLIYGKEFWFPRFDIFLLSVGTGFYILAKLYSQTAMVKKGAGYVAMIWAIATIALIAFSIGAPLPLLRRVEVSYIVANGFVAAVLAYQSYMAVYSNR